MAIERVILELQEKLLSLSDEVEQLTKRVSALEKQDVNSTPKSNDRKTKIQGSISKDMMITSIKNALADKIPPEKIKKATRQDGSGIVLIKDKKKIKICLRGSGFYGEEDVSTRMKYTGFSTITKKTIGGADGQMNYDFFIFIVNHSNIPTEPKMDFFIFDQEQFRALLKEKKPSGKNEMYYFYFGETTDGHYIDDREKDKMLLLDDVHDGWDKIITEFNN